MFKVRKISRDTIIDDELSETKEANWSESADYSQLIKQNPNIKKSTIPFADGEILHIGVDSEWVNEGDKNGILSWHLITTEAQPVSANAMTWVLYEYHL